MVGGECIISQTMHYPAVLGLSAFFCGGIMGVSHTGKTVKSPAIQPRVHIHIQRLLTDCQHCPACPTAAVSGDRLA